MTPTVLTIEGDPLVLEVVGRLVLEGGYDTIVAGDGRDAWGILHRERISQLWPHGCGRSLVQGQCGEPRCWRSTWCAGAAAGDWRTRAHDAHRPALACRPAHLPGPPFSWGVNDEGQTAHPISEYVPAPALVRTGHSLSELDAGVAHTCGLAQDGVYCWGSKTAGQLGRRGDLTAMPVRVN